MTAETAPAEATEIVNAFAGLGLDAKLVEALTAGGYTEPTPIQRQAIPAILAGSDLIGLAATGTGKTAAFALPIIHKLAANPNRGRPSAIVLVPTRELAIQVATAMEKYGKPLKITVVPVYGGAGFGDQARQLRGRADIVVATPGRCLDHIRRGTMNLKDIAAVVLDEADEMLDMGFADDLDAILTETPKTRQTMLFSATMPPRIAAIASKHLTDPKRVEVKREKPAAGEAPKVRELVYLVPREHKTNALARLLDFEAPTAALVFCRTRAEADGVADKLTSRGYRPESLHGGLSQDQRDRVMKKFRDGSAPVLIATDVAARGLDVNHLSHVINYNVPESGETYVHRIGRTGRAGREGVAITLMEQREQHLMRAVERVLNRRIDGGQIPTKAELQAKRLERTRDALRTTIKAGGLDEFLAIIGPLAKEFDATDVALAAVALMTQDVRNGDDGPEIPQVGANRMLPRPEDRATTGLSSGRPRTEVRRAGKPGGGMTRVFIGAGREAGVARRDLTMAIENEAGLASKDIGNIEMAERFSLVEVPGELADYVVESLQGVRFRGRSVVVRRDKMDGGMI